MDKFRHFVLDRHTSFLPGRRQLGTEEKGGGVWFNREPVSVKSTRNREEAITVVDALSLRHTAQESTSFLSGSKVREPRLPGISPTARLLPAVNPALTDPPWI